MAKRGGKRPGAGRPKGSRDTATVEQKATLEELARSHAPTALDALVNVYQNSESDSARVSAASAVLDRGYGKPGQSVEHKGDADNPIAVSITESELARRALFALAKLTTGEK